MSGRESTKGNEYDGVFDRDARLPVKSNSIIDNVDCLEGVVRKAGTFAIVGLGMLLVAQGSIRQVHSIRRCDADAIGLVGFGGTRSDAFSCGF